MTTPQTRSFARTDALLEPADDRAALPTRDRRAVEWFVLALTFVLVNVAGAIFQRQITFNHGKAWEGEFYYDVAEQYSGGHWQVASEAPLVYRVGTPFLASLLHRSFLPGDLFACFRVVNLVANALTLILLILWLRRFLRDWRIRTGLALVFLLQWDTPTRWLYFYPAHTDPWMWVFLLAGLLAVERYREQPSTRRMLVVAVLGIVGVAFREVVLLVPAAFCFVANPLARPGDAPFWLALASVVRRASKHAVPLLGTVTALLAIRLVAHQTNGYSFGATALHFLYEKPALIYLQSLFVAYGPILWLPLLTWRSSARFLSVHQPLAVYVAAAAFLALIGGTDTERLFFWSMPVIYVLAGRALEGSASDILRSPIVLGGLLLAQAVASRVFFWPIPDHPDDFPYRLPLFTPFGSHVAFMELFSFFQPRTVQIATLAEYLGLGAVLAGWMQWRRFAVERDGRQA